MTNNLKQHKYPITQAQANDLKKLFEEDFPRGVVNKRSLRRIRIGQLMKLVRVLEIQFDQTYIFDFKKLAHTYRQLKEKYDIRHPISLLLLVKTIEPILSKNCVGGLCYSVEYYIGLKKVHHCEGHT